MITIFLLGIYNGLFIAWGQKIKKKEKTWSKYWHGVGRLLILSIFFDGFLFESIVEVIGILMYSFICLNLAWTIFNFNINLVRKLCGTPIGIFHLGSTGFDKWMISIFGLIGTWLIGFGLIVVNLGLLFL